MHPSTDRHGVSTTDLARWGLLDRVLRERCMDGVLADRALPEPAQLAPLRLDWEQQHNLASAEQVQAWMDQHGLDAEAIDRMASRSWQWLLWCQERWGSELQTIFLKRKPELDQVTYSLLRLRNGELASEPVRFGSSCRCRFSLGSLQNRRLPGLGPAGSRRRRRGDSG